MKNTKHKLQTNRIAISENRTHDVSALKNQGGYFVYARSKIKTHKRSKLIIRIDKNKIELNGRQAQSLRKLLNSI